jgi:hypothetical protein
MRHIFFFVTYAIILRLLAGCSTLPAGTLQQNYAYYNGVRTSGVIPDAMSRWGYGWQGNRYQVPVPPSNVGFMYREPVGWEDNNPRSFRLMNNTDNLHGRCWVDGREVVPTVWGAVPQGPVQTQTGVKLAGLLPPNSETYFIVSVGRHHLKCQLYAGPAPFQLAYEMNVAFQTNGNGGRTFYVHPDHMLSSRSLPAN